MCVCVCDIFAVCCVLWVGSRAPLLAAQNLSVPIMSESSALHELDLVFNVALFGFSTPSKINDSKKVNKKGRKPLSLLTQSEQMLGPCLISKCNNQHGNISPRQCTKSWLQKMFACWEKMDAPCMLDTCSICHGVLHFPDECSKCC